MADIGLVIKIPEKNYEHIKEQVDKRDYPDMLIGRAIANGTPLTISADGTLTITVEDATKIGRVLVQDDKHNGGLFYGDCD